MSSKESDFWLEIRLVDKKAYSTIFDYSGDLDFGIFDNIRLKINGKRKKKKKKTKKR